jgi:hypothetical protein
MRILIAIIFILISVNVQAGLFSKEKPEVCHFQIQFSTGVFYVFMAPCGQIKQVGLIDSGGNELITYDDKMKADASYTYFTKTKKQELIQSNWPGLILVPVLQLN